MRLILVIYEHAQHNDNQCLRYVACLLKAINDFLP
jgi:hypothetical protein